MYLSRFTKTFTNTFTNTVTNIFTNTLLARGDPITLPSIGSPRANNVFVKIFVTAFVKVFVNQDKYIIYNLNIYNL